MTDLDWQGDRPLGLPMEQLGGRCVGGVRGVASGASKARGWGLEHLFTPETCLLPFPCLLPQVIYEMYVTGFTKDGSINVSSPGKIVI